MREKIEPPPNESQTYSSGNSNGPPDLRLVHYNDVYHIDASSAEPVGGAARFITLMEHYRHGEQFQGQSDLITFFSGDAFNPSLESSITKGQSKMNQSPGDPCISGICCKCIRPLFGIFTPWWPNRLIY